MSYLATIKFNKEEQKDLKVIMESLARVVKVGLLTKQRARTLLRQKMYRLNNINRSK